MGTDISIGITDEYARKAMREYYYPQGNDQSILSGESGAAGLAGFLSIMADPEMQILKSALKLIENSRVLFFNTEGATDPDSFQKIINA